MDLTEYSKEIKKLQSELQSLESSATDEEAPSTAVGFMKYKNYVIATAGSFLFLFLFKPKFVLKIALVDDVPQMIVDRGKFAIWWVAMSGIICLACYMYLKTKKQV